MLQAVTSKIKIKKKTARDQKTRNSSPKTLTIKDQNSSINLYAISRSCDFFGSVI